MPPVPAPALDGSFALAVARVFVPVFAGAFVPVREAVAFAAPFGCGAGFSGSARGCARARGSGG
ncbi:hypothetical protein Smic_81940 [Streptomyces microflavus]|uniref:Uncharacterized protein n=1 Tax=Streptomyces microflavus TaxID=1919 RepID=A0A7J0D4L3_STRMI|nr:hypothetical protein Smic_81940 [Streptomyces microflavus]